MRICASALATLASALAIPGASAIATEYTGGVSQAPENSIATGEREKTASVTVNLQAKRQLMQGFGSSARVWADPHLSETPATSVPESVRQGILRDLYGRLGLTRVRPVLDQGVQKQRGGPFAFGGKLADDHIAFVKQARRYGLKTFLPGPVYVEPWIGPEDVGAYVDWAMAMLQRWRAAGLEPPLYAPQNEPQVNGDFSPDFLRRVVIQLGQRLRTAGFKTKLVVPDDENPVDAYRRASAILSDPEARKYVGAVAYHVYRIGDTGDIVRMGQLAAKYGLPVWMTEYWSAGYDAWPGALDWAIRMHTLMAVGRVSAVDYLWGFFGSWAGPAAMVSLDFENGVYRSKSFTPIYWLTGQWSRYLRPGYRRVAATAEAGGVLTSAFTGAGKVVLVSINPADAATTVQYTVTGGRLSPGKTFPGFRTAAEERWRPLTATPTRGSRFTTRLPPRSVTTYVLTTAAER